MDLQEAHQIAADNGTLVREQLKRRIPKYVRITYGTTAFFFTLWWGLKYVTPLLPGVNLEVGTTSNLIWLAIPCGIIGFALLILAAFKKGN